MLRIMGSEYYFDKRKWKRIFIKYGLIFLISFVPIVLFNVYVGPSLGREWLVILIDTAVLLVCVIIGSHIANSIFAKNDAKLEKKRREREYVRARSQAILEESYKKKRQAKADSKKNKNDIVIEVEEKETENDTVTTEDVNPVPPNDKAKKSKGTQKKNISIKRRK